jgi:hypothetical protein
LELPKAQWRTLASLGHGIERYFQARRNFAIRVAKPGRFDEWKPYFQGAPEASESRLLEDVGTFATVLRSTAIGFSFDTLLLNSESTALAISHHVDLNPSCKAPIAPIPLSAADEAAIWPALIRMKPLQSFWELEMRTNHYQTMKKVLPDAWVLDSSPIPPGAVIPRLEISDWGDIETIRYGGRDYKLSGAWQKEVLKVLSSEVLLEEWRDSLNNALENFPPKVQVFSELVSAKDNHLIIAIYEKTEKRTDFIGALLISESSIGKVISM